MTTETITYDPLPTLVKFHKHPGRIRCIVGPVGSGKTTAATWELCYYIPHQMFRKHGIKKTRWLILRNTYPELIDTTQKTVFDWFSWGEYHTQRKEYIIKYPKTGVEVEILFRSCDNPKDVRHFKSLELTGYWIDESIEVSQDVKLMLVNRIGRYPRQSPCSYGIQTTNPPDIEDPTYTEFKWITEIPGPVPEKPPLKEHFGFWQPPGENNENLPEGYYKRLIDAYANNLDWADRYVRGLPGITVKGRNVYNNFRRDLHVAKEPIEYVAGKRLYAGWDNTGNCPACVVAYSPTAGMLHILKEYHTERMGIVDFCDYVIADRNDRWPNAEWVEWGDPAGEARFSKSGGGLTSNAELMLQSGIRLKSSEQNWAARREAVEYQLGRLVAGEPALLIDPSCHRLINGFLGGYCYPEVGTTGIYRDSPEKNKFSHIHDALQYMLVMLLRNVNYRSNDRPSFEFTNFRDREQSRSRDYYEVYT